MAILYYIVLFIFDFLIIIRFFDISINRKNTAIKKENLNAKSVKTKLKVRLFEQLDLLFILTVSNAVNAKKIYPGRNNLQRIRIIIYIVKKTTMSKIIRHFTSMHFLFNIHDTNYSLLAKSYFYSRKYAPKCCACNLPIAPKDGETTAQRLTAFEKDWHPDCFKCQV